MIIVLRGIDIESEGERGREIEIDERGKERESRERDEE